MEKDGVLGLVEQLPELEFARLQCAFRTDTVGDVDAGGDESGDAACGIPQQGVMPSDDALFATARDDRVFRGVAEGLPSELTADQRLDLVALAFWQLDVEPVLADDLVWSVSEEVKAFLVEAHEPEVRVDDLHDDPRRIEVGFCLGCLDACCFLSIVAGCRVMCDQQDPFVGEWADAGLEPQM